MVRRRRRPRRGAENGGIREYSDPVLQAKANAHTLAHAICHPDKRPLLVMFRFTQVGVGLPLFDRRERPPRLPEMGTATAAIIDICCGAGQRLMAALARDKRHRDQSPTPHCRQ
jgi:hypothetical protein